MPVKPRLGLTTDDGWEAVGYHELIGAFADFGGDVLCAAPTRQWPSYGTALGSFSPDGGIERPRRRDVGGAVVFGFDSTPGAVARCLAQSTHWERCDYLVSGVNHGPNIGSGLIHSGTVGAALIASWLGLGAVAVSLDDVHSVDEDDPGPLKFKESALIARHALQWLISRRLRVVCNINVPNSIDLATVRCMAADPAVARARFGLPDEATVLRDGNIAITVFGSRSLASHRKLSEAAASDLNLLLRPTGLVNKRTDPAILAGDVA